MRTAGKLCWRKGGRECVTRHAEAERNGVISSGSPAGSLGDQEALQLSRLPVRFLMLSSPLCVSLTLCFPAFFTSVTPPRVDDGALLKDLKGFILRKHATAALLAKAVAAVASADADASASAGAGAGKAAAAGGTGARAGAAGGEACADAPPAQEVQPAQGRSIRTRSLRGLSIAEQRHSEGAAVSGSSGSGGSQSSVGAPAVRLPTARELEEAGRGDLGYFILRNGRPAIAQKLGLRAPVRFRRSSTRQGGRADGPGSGTADDDGDSDDESDDEDDRPPAARAEFEAARAFAQTLGLSTRVRACSPPSFISATCPCVVFDCTSAIKGCAPTQRTATRVAESALRPAGRMAGVARGPRSLRAPDCGPFSAGCHFPGRWLGRLGGFPGTSPADGAAEEARAAHVSARQLKLIVCG